MTIPSPDSTSPKWGSTVKLIVGLSFVAIVAGMLIYFRQIIGPLLLAFMLSYLLHPLAMRLSNTFKLSWRTSVAVVYLTLVILLIGVFTLIGLAAVQQIENLYTVVSSFVEDLPHMVADLSTKVYYIGPFPIDLSQSELGNISERVLTYVQPLLGEVGGLVGSFATSALTTIGWLVFVLVISYFLLAGTSRVPLELLYVEIPGYDVDIRRLGEELRRIWNAFLRGQLTVIILVIITYTILLTGLGVRYSLAIAILAGLARLVPYVGPAITWTILVVVTFFQRDNYFGLQAWQYSLMILVICIIIDQIFDQIISPRLLGDTVGVHPAAVLIGAIIATRTIGIVGLVLVAPFLASLKLLGGYAFRKMLDLDPWLAMEEENRRRPREPAARLFRRAQAWMRMIKEKIT